jgi:hypothetical protein
MRSFLPYDGDFLRRRNVVPSVKKGRQFNPAEFFQYLFTAFGLCKAPAHGRMMDCG